MLKLTIQTGHRRPELNLEGDKGGTHFHLHLGKSLSGRENSKYRNPEVRVCLPVIATAKGWSGSHWSLLGF